MLDFGKRKERQAKIKIKLYVSSLSSRNIGIENNEYNKHMHVSRRRCRRRQ